MATFPSINPSFDIEKRSTPRVKVVTFNDGYEQRLTFGLPSHQNPKEWDLTWENISTADATTIEDFLDARALDAASFDWSPPDTTSTYKWKCNEWNKSLPYPNLATITATFIEVFEP